MTRVEKFYFYLMLYTVLVLALPLMLLAHFFDSFNRTFFDVCELHKHIHYKFDEVEARLAKAKADAEA